MSAIGNTNTKDNESLGSEKKDITSGFDLSALNPETIENIQKVIESAQSLMTAEEKKHKEIQQKKNLEYQRRLTDAVEKESEKELFEIPIKSGKTYKFIGYSTDQFEEIMTLGNQADNIPDDQRGSLAHLKMQSEVWKKTVKYSLENIPDDVLNKLPKKQLHWFWMVLKEKNDNPLPFGLSVSNSGSS